ncbi:MAG: adenosylcobinamide-GDP ribazoletransferase, partial [Chloroflexi bacterium]
MNAIKNTLTDFVMAWQLLTAIPLPFAPAESGRPPGYAAVHFPLVGAVLGLLLAAAAEPLFWLFPAEIAAALLLALWVGATGMLHLDGFMDSCDGLLPPREAARRLEIMKDSRVGAFGAVGGVLLLLLKFNGLAALPPTHRVAALVVIPMLGRWAQTWA